MCISLMLLGCMGFMMATFYLVNWPDDDIQQITWEIISSTTSIFGALLMFQGCNRVVNYYFLDHVATWHQLVVNMVHMMLWFCVLQLVLAYYSGAVGQQEVPAARRAALSRAASCDGEMRSVHLECAEKHMNVEPGVERFCTKRKKGTVEESCWVPPGIFWPWRRI